MVLIICIVVLQTKQRQREMLMSPCAALNCTPGAFFSNITAASSCIGAKRHGPFSLAAGAAAQEVARLCIRITSPHSPIASIRCLIQSLTPLVQARSLPSWMPTLLPRGASSYAGAGLHFKFPFCALLLYFMIVLVIAADCGPSNVP